jgi:hypothetical protein
MVVVVYGFPSRFAALQFEWAWQNPHKSRHLKNAYGQSFFTGKQREKLLTGKLQALSHMLGSSHWVRWPLQLHFCADAVFDAFQAAAPIPPHIKITKGSLNTLPFNEDDSEDGNFFSYLDTDLVTYVCAECEEPLDESAADYLRCNHPPCTLTAHIICLSARFLREEYQKHKVKNLIPLGGTCPLCKVEVKWGDLIHAMKIRMRKATENAVLASGTASGSEPLIIRKQPLLNRQGTAMTISLEIEQDLDTVSDFESDYDEIPQRIGQIPQPAPIVLISSDEEIDEEIAESIRIRRLGGWKAGENIAAVSSSLAKLTL